MKLRYAVIAAALVALLAATAAFAATKTRTMAGSAYISSGGKLEMNVKREGANQFEIEMELKTMVKSGTVLAFTAYPCGSNRCADTARRKQRVSSKRGIHTVTYGATIARVRSSSGKACVFGEVRDLGPRGRGNGRVLRTKSGKLGIRYCQ
jgi:hypothetical protein